MRKSQPTFSYLLLAGFIASLSACGGGGGGSEKPPAPTSSAAMSSLNSSAETSLAASSIASAPQLSDSSQAQSSLSSSHAANDSSLSVSSISSNQSTTNNGASSSTGNNDGAPVISSVNNSSSQPAASSLSSRASSVNSSIASSTKSSVASSISSNASSVASSVKSSVASSLSSRSSSVTSSMNSSIASSLSSRSSSVTSSINSSVASSLSSRSSSLASSMRSSTSSLASSISSRASSMSSSISSVSSSTSSAATWVGNASRGETLYTDKGCGGCHGPADQSNSGNFPINMVPYLYGSLDLHKVIHDTMPLGNPSACVDQCAADIAAFMKTWSVQQTEPLAACDGELTYSARQLKLLTRAEYQASAEDLVKIDFDLAAALPSDSRVHGYSNNANTVVSQVHQDAYYEAAAKIGAFAHSKNFAGIVSCDLANKDACLTDFTNNFAAKVFRRPLTKQETFAFASLFNDSYTDGDVKAGLQMAVTAAFMAPGFLYRSEQGVPVVLGEHDGNGYEYVGTPTSMTAADFGDKRHFVTGSLSGALIVGDTTNSRQEGKLGRHLSYTGAGTLMHFRVRGLGAEGEAPVIRYGVGSFSGSIKVDWDDWREFSLYFPGLSGHSEMAFYIAPGPARVEFHNFRYGPAQAVAGAPDRDAYALTQHELATFLAYTFTGSTPDDLLLAAANTGALTSDAQISAQVERLLKTPRAKSRLGDFAAQWVGSDLVLTQPKDMGFEALTDELRRAMAQEVRELFAHAALSGNSFKEFFATDSAFVNGPLASYYNLSGASGNGFSKVNGNGQRGGIFTTGAFHVAYGQFEATSPIIRAARVREKFLCQEIPPPPAGIAIDRAAAEAEIAHLIASGGTVSQRRRTELLTGAPYCAACHEKIINPLGFGMEDFDTIGRYQAVEVKGAPVDASGVLWGVNALPALDSSMLTFSGSKGLGEALGEERVVYECFVENAFRFVTGMGVELIDKNDTGMRSLTPAEVAANSCSVQSITEQMVDANYDPRLVFKSLATMKLIRYRKEYGVAE